MKEVNAVLVLHIYTHGIMDKSTWYFLPGSKHQMVVFNFNWNSGMEYVIVRIYFIFWVVFRIKGWEPQVGEVTCPAAVRK